MNVTKQASVALATVGVLVGGLAWAAFREPTRGQDPSSARASPPAPGEDGRLPDGPEAGSVADIRGLWEVVYMAGTVSGRREGYAIPGLVVPITAETINFPGLTGDPKSPMSYLGRKLYTLRPGAAQGEIDIEAGPGEVKALQGVYRLKGDVLAICYDQGDRGRPQSFDGGRPTEILFILHRAPPAPAAVLRRGGPLPPPTPTPTAVERF